LAEIDVDGEEDGEDQPGDEINQQTLPPDLSLLLLGSDELVNEEERDRKSGPAGEDAHDHQGLQHREFSLVI